MKKPVIAFTIADKKNNPYADMMITSLRKFHNRKDLPVIVYEPGPEELKDPQFFYRATPYYALKLIKEYDLVLKLDADQIVMGNLDYILNNKDYDVGTVLNINRVDPPVYGLVQGWGIEPNEYFNCGLVAMRSEDFVHEWWSLCNSKYFSRLQYREQDLLNVLCHYAGFRYKVNCFDDYDEISKYYAWHGLVAKGEGIHMKVVGDKIILPKGKDGYPDRDLEIKLYHFAGGQNEQKMNYRIAFNEDVIKRIDELIK